MYLIPIVRTSRAICACYLIPDYPILAITISEITSYIIPFINNSPLNATNNIILFTFYYIFYNSSAIEIINKYKNRYKLNYYLEILAFLTIFLIY